MRGRSGRTSVLVATICLIATGPTTAHAATITGADNAVTKSAPASAAVGDSLPYEIEVTNLGSNDANDVTVTDPLPASTTFVGVSGTAECEYNSGNHTVACLLGTIPMGGSTSVTITVEPTSQGMVTNTATAASPDDSNSTNDSDDATTDVGPGGGPPPSQDADGDGISDSADNCPSVSNRGQGDQDGDGIGDLCDDDSDGDSIGPGDNCPATPNQDQADTDNDGAGDACDEDDDGDGVEDRFDGCPAEPGSDDGCPEPSPVVVRTESSISYSSDDDSFQGDLDRLLDDSQVPRWSSGSGPCVSDREVRLKKVRPGRDRAIGSDLSSAKGLWKIFISPTSRGKFYAAVPAVQRTRADGTKVICRKARSATVGRLSH